MRKVLITLAFILAVAGIILLNALTFSGRYARMMETSITVTSADDSFIGKKMKEFFAREDLEEKLAHEMESLPLFPDHPEYHEELASLAVSLGRDTSLEQVRCQGAATTADTASHSPCPKKNFNYGKTALRKIFRKTGSHPSPTGTAPTSASANSPAGRKNRKMVTFPTYRAVPAFSSPGAA